jgi:hypothetical protein
MTVAEWIAEQTQPSEMLEAIEERRASVRKLRLFTCACDYRIWDSLKEDVRQVIAVLERLADGQASDTELSEAEIDPDPSIGFVRMSAIEGASSAAEAAAAPYPDDASGECPEFLAERTAQCHLLRDIFGNPFRPLPPRPEAIAPLAEQIYAGAWDKMPLLGEWLQENGYWSEGEHCLDPKNRHVKGCWVVDWVTGRE